MTLKINHLYYCNEITTYQMNHMDLYLSWVYSNILLYNQFHHCSTVPLLHWWLNTRLALYELWMYIQVPHLMMQLWKKKKNPSILCLRCKEIHCWHTFCILTYSVSKYTKKCKNPIYNITAISFLQVEKWEQIYIFHLCIITFLRNLHVCLFHLLYFI